MARWLFIGVIGRLIPLSTEQGQLRALALMGWSHEMGQGSEQDLAQAIALYCQLVQAGDAFGQYRLAERYLRGVGVQRNLRTAFHWMELAAATAMWPPCSSWGALSDRSQQLGQHGGPSSGAIRRPRRATRWHCAPAGAGGRGAQ